MIAHVDHKSEKNPLHPLDLPDPCKIRTPAQSVDHE